jgi:predicted Fe-Mo cluster-binding NifX family protein
VLFFSDQPGVGWFYRNTGLFVRQPGPGCFDRGFGNRLYCIAGRVDRVLIHYEPMKKETIVVAVPLEIDRVTLSKHFGEAPVYYIASIRESDGKILEESFLANPFFNEEKAKGIKVSKWLLQKGMDRLFTSKDLAGKGAGYVLSDAGVGVLPVQGTILAELHLI